MPSHPVPSSSPVPVSLQASAQAYRQVLAQAGGLEVDALMQRDARVVVCAGL